MSTSLNKTLKIGYLNLRAQTGFGTTKQAQVEHLVKQHKFDILHLQEAQILEDSFESCDYINSNYTVLSNNARNPYGTASLVAIYISVAFSDHMASIYTITTPASIHKSLSPKHKPQFKS